MRALLDMGAKDVAIVRDGAEHRVPIEQLGVGDLFLVRPGEKVATDGVAVEGSSAVDASMLRQASPSRSRFRLVTPLWVRRSMREVGSLSGRPGLAATRSWPRWRG